LFDGDPMSTMRRIECKHCKAHILGDQLFCSVCLSPRPKGLLSAEWLFVGFILLWAAALAYLAQLPLG
jgi:RNA polymerase subunit RPABC4/transcription elongation factor Spt4